jgi:hypothetical protein
MQEAKKDLELFSRTMFNKASVICVVWGATISVGFRHAFTAWMKVKQNHLINKNFHLGLNILPGRKSSEDGL